MKDQEQIERLQQENGSLRVLIEQVNRHASELSGQLQDSLRSKLLLSNQFREMENSVVAHQLKNSQLQERINALETQVADLKDKNGQLLEQIAVLRGKRVNGTNQNDGIRNVIGRFKNKVADRVRGRGGNK